MVVSGNGVTSHAWHPTKSSEKYGVAIYNFDSTKINHALSLRVGETIQISEEQGDWYRGCLIKDQSRKGIFPKICVVLKDATVTNVGRYEIVTPKAEPLVVEVANVLREWGAIWKGMFVKGEMEMFTELKVTMNDLMSWRNDMVMGQYTQEQQAEVREKVTLTIDLMNYRLNLDMVPRINSEIVVADNISVVELYNIHVNCSDKVGKARKRKGRNCKGHTSTSMYRGFHTFRRQSLTLKRNSIMSFKTPHCSHLLLSYKTLICDISDPMELCFGVYDSSKANFISENYVVSLDKFGSPTDINLLGKAFALYMDLTGSDLSKPLYLVCKIFRRGKLIPESKKKVVHHDFRRPFAAAAVLISDVLSGEYDDEKELYMPIMNCNQETDFGVIEEYITRNMTGKYSSFGSNPVVAVGLKMYYGSPEKVMKEKATCALTQRLGFPEVILPGYVRNDFYVTLYKAEFEKGSKSSAKNIEVAMCAVSSKGQVFNDCIFIGSGAGSVSEYRSSVFYHCNNPCWNETIRVSLPLEQFHQAHLRFTFNHCTRNEGFKKGNKERTFGFSYLNLLQDDSTVIKDMSYDLFVYKNDSSIKFRGQAVETYLRLPSNQFEVAKQERNGVTVSGPSRSARESLTIRTFLCSTKLTQNFSIVNLLRWRKKDHKEVLDALEKLPSVPPEEVVKFIQDVFDALFNILSERNDDFALPVFKALVSITKIVEDIKYEHFKSTLNSYVEEHFSAALVYKSLIGSLCYVIDNSSDSGLKVTVKNTMQSLTYVFKIIIRSYVLHNSSLSNPNELTDLQELFRGLFRSMAQMMNVAEESLIQPKIDMLKKLPYLCQDVAIVFTYTEFSCYVEDIFKALPRQGHIHSAFIQVCKLKAFQAVVESELFADPGGRGVLLPAILDYLGYQMEKRQELPSCLDLLADIITVMQNLGPDNVLNDISTICNCLLVNLIKVLLTVERKSNTIGICVSCLLGLLKLMDKRHYQLFISTFKEQSELKDFMMKLTLSFKELLTMEIFPKDWFVLKTVQNYVILTAAQYFSKAFTDHFLDDYFEEKLWNNYFQLSVLFLTQSALKVESFSASKRETLVGRYGDMRVIMSFEVLSMWEVLGDKKKYFIPELIKPMLEMTLVPETDLRKSTIPLFYDMMKVEFAENHSFEKVESELIEKLVDLIDNKNLGDQDYEKLFHKIMMDKFDQCPDPKLHEEGKKLIISITELLKRLLDNRAASKGNVNNKQKMMCIVRLIEYYKELGRQSMYIKCIYNLVELHISCSNYTEAAFTLLLHASLLKWSDDILETFLNYPEQCEWQRKEQLYLQIIDYFDRGKTWESAIQICKELAEEYENRFIDYTKLSQILKKQADFYDNIMRETRPPPTYFRVSFYGNGFPHYIKNEVLIFRGLELETLAGFTLRIKGDFPDAEILYKNTPPDASIVNGSGQHIQLCTVNPIPCQTKLFQMKSVDEKIINYFLYNGVTEFVYSRPYHKGTKDPTNEFKTLWLERTVHWSRRKFPGILKWSTIESTRKTDLTPIENAIESITQKNREIEARIAEYVENKSLNINRLSMVLNGVIDANVNGGIANYQSAFLSTQYILNNPENEDCVLELRSLLSEQSVILEKGLDIHQKLISENLQPFHDKMLMQFSAMKTSIKTGEPLENVLSRPKSLQLNNTLPAKLPGRSPKASPPAKLVNSPKGSPPSDSKRTSNLSKSNSDVQELLKKEKAIGKGILNSILRRSSVTCIETVIESDGSKRNSTATARKSSAPGTPDAEIPSDLSLAAQKRLGILKPGLTNSAPALGYIQEERTVVVPPKDSSSCGEFDFSNLSLDSPNSKHTTTGYDVLSTSTPKKDSTEHLHLNIDPGRTPCTSTSKHGIISSEINGNAPIIDNLGDLCSKINDLSRLHDVEEEHYANEKSAPILLARCASTTKSIHDDADRPELPSRRLKPRTSLQSSVVENDSSDGDSPPPLPKKMGRTGSNASTLSNSSVP